MKKARVIIVVFALLSVSIGSFAQAQFSLGLKGGLNFANLDVSSPTTTYENRTGYHVGAFTLIKFEKIGIQPEVMFSQQGSKVKSPNTSDFSSNFNYVNVPVILKLYTVAGINLQVGPQFGFLMNDPVVKDVNGTTIENAYKSSDISVALGVGWDLPFGLTIDGRYNLGLTDVEDNPTLEATRNQVWQVSLGYKLFTTGK